MADIVFNCADCGQKFNAPEDSTGTEFECRECGAKVIVPSATPTPTPTPGPTTPGSQPAATSRCSMNGLSLELKQGKKGVNLCISGPETDHRIALRWINKVVVDLGDTTLGFVGKLILLIVLLVGTAGIGVIIAFFLGLSPTRRQPTLILGLVDEEAVRRSIGTDVLGFSAATREELVGAATWLRDETNVTVEIPDDAPSAAAVSPVTPGKGTTAKSKTGSQKKQINGMDIGRALVGLLAAFLFSVIVAWECFALTGKLTAAVSGMFFSLTAAILLLAYLPKIRPDIFQSTSKIPFPKTAGLLLGGYVGLGIGIYFVLFLGSLIGLYDFASGGHVLRANATIRGGAANGNRIVLLDAKGDIGAWSMPTSEPLAPVPKSGGKPTCLGISADGRNAIAGWKDGGIAAWGVEGGAVLKELSARDSVQAVAVHSEPLMVAFGIRGNESELNGEVWLWRIGEEPRKLAGRNLNGMLDTLAFSPDGRFVAASFRRVSGTHMVQIRLLGTSEETADGGSFSLDQQIVGEFTTILFNASGKTFAAGSTKGFIHLGRLQDSGRYQINTSSAGVSGVKALAFLPDGKRLLCGRLTGELELWQENLEASNELVPASRSAMRFVASAPDGLSAYYSASSSLLKQIKFPVE